MSMTLRLAQRNPLTGVFVTRAGPAEIGSRRIAVC
jgi:hypothetical protein